MDDSGGRYDGADDPLYFIQATIRQLRLGGFYDRHHNAGNGTTGVSALRSEDGGSQPGGEGLKRER